MQHTLQLKIDDSIFEKFMGFLEILPKNKIEITQENDYPSVTMEQAKEKVSRAINNISSNNGVHIDEAFESILKTK